ncbi:MAG: sigma-54 factor interaction domain-containing protein, partial [Syntrophales bacterium]|nr:sigma-54 factor interaction domain-containing protein [Syntrophales bacterium]
MPDLETIIQRVGIIGQHPALQKTLKDAALAARGEHPVFIVGETGTGKELLSRFIHEASRRRHRDFHAVNCGAFSTELLASELFG